MIDVVCVASMLDGTQIGVPQTVKAILRSLNALMIMGEAHSRLHCEFKSSSPARLDVQHNAVQERAALRSLHQARRPYSPSMQAAHRRRLLPARTTQEAVFGLMRRTYKTSRRA